MTFSGLPAVTAATLIEPEEEEKKNTSGCLLD